MRALWEGEVEAILPCLPTQGGCKQDDCSAEEDNGEEENGSGSQIVAGQPIREKEAELTMASKYRKE